MKKSMRTTGKFGALVIGLCLLSAPAFAATDYSSMTNDELAAMRGTMRDAEQVDRDAFRSEWQERVSNMSTEERNNAVGRPANAPQDGAGNRYGGGNGRGMSSGMGGGQGMGRGRR